MRLVLKFMFSSLPRLGNKCHFWQTWQLGYRKLWHDSTSQKQVIHEKSNYFLYLVKDFTCRVSLKRQKWEHETHYNKIF